MTMTMTMTMTKHADGDDDGDGDEHGDDGNDHVSCFGTEVYNMQECLVDAA